MSLKHLFYKAFYLPPVNFIVRNFIRTINDVFKTDFRISVSGKMKLKLADNKSFFLKLNESGSGHVYFWERAMNFEFTPIFVKLIARTNVFLDIGANIGFYTGVANAINPKVQVWAFEPAEGPHHFLLKNKEVNGWKHTQVVNLALSDTDGEITFFEGKRPKYSYLRYHLSGIGATQNTHDNPDMITYPVRTQTLDGFVAEHSIATIDLIKMDTEATEHYILSKGYGTLMRDRPIIICEVLFGKIENEIQTHILALEMKMFEQIGSSLIPVASLTKFDDNKERTFFFVPHEKLDWIAEFVQRN